MKQQQKKKYSQGPFELSGAVERIAIRKKKEKKSKI